MPPGFQLHELAPRYAVESFSEDEWHTYSGEKTAKIIAEHLSSATSVSKWLLNAGAAGAIIDRFLHHVQVIAITGKSYRVKEAPVVTQESKK